MSFLSLILALAQILTSGAGAQKPASGGGSNPVVVQSGTCSGTTSCTINLSSTTTGDYILVYQGSNGNSTGIAMSLTGATFSNLTGASGCSNNTGLEGDCWLATNITGATTPTLTSTCTTGVTCNTMVLEISSPSGGHAQDAGGNAHATTTAMTVSTSAATTNAGDICVGMAYTNQGGSYTSLNWTQVINDATHSLLAESTLPGSTGTQTATATGPAGTGNMPEGVLCLKP